jgi:hypothetical protein
MRFRRPAFHRACYSTTFATHPDSGTTYHQHAQALVRVRCRSSPDFAASPTLHYNIPAHFLHCDGVGLDKMAARALLDCPAYANPRFAPEFASLSNTSPYARLCEQCRPTCAWGSCTPALFGAQLQPKSQSHNLDASKSHEPGGSRSGRQQDAVTIQILCLILLCKK